MPGFRSSPPTFPAIAIWSSTIRPGFCIALGDRATLARLTQRLFEDPALAESLGAAGRVGIREQFTVDKMVERYVDFYDRLLP